MLRKSKTSDTQSVVIVVSALIALMKDQVRQMTERNVKAVYVGEIDDATETGGMRRTVPPRVPQPRSPTH